MSDVSKSFVSAIVSKTKARGVTHRSNVTGTGDTSSTSEQEGRTEEVDEATENGKLVVGTEGNETSELADTSAGELDSTSVGRLGDDCKGRRGLAKRRRVEARELRTGGDEVAVEVDAGRGSGVVVDDDLKTAQC